MVCNSTLEEANDISKRIQSYIKKHNRKIIFTASFGITQKILEDIIKRADKALYKSKEDGKDRISIL